MTSFLRAAVVAVLAGAALTAQSTPSRSSGPPAASKVPKYGYTVVRSFPHDPKAYTQGLEYRDGFLYEGTGLKGRSAVRKVELESGKVVQEEKLHPQYFGEGITIAAGKLYQVTWQDKAGFVYDAKTLKFIRNFGYFGEGWGLTHDNLGLVMSDGTNILRFLELTRFRETRRLRVMDAGAAIPKLNELEWIRGEIWANVWETDYIARISPKDGHVLGWIDLKGLLGAPNVKLGPEAVLNGIAYDAQKDRLFVTGKLWPRVFEIKIAPK
jgi:glutaminyl-peptide cyclotransferase